MRRRVGSEQEGKDRTLAPLGFGVGEGGGREEEREELVCGSVERVRRREGGGRRFGVEEGRRRQEAGGLFEMRIWWSGFRGSVVGLEAEGSGFNVGDERGGMTWKEVRVGLVSERGVRGEGGGTRGKVQ